MLPTRLGHLLAGQAQHPVVHPDAREALAGRLRLGALVLVVREDQVEPAAVDVEVLAQLGVSHRRALDVPARAPAPPGRVPGGVLARLRGLPEREVERRPLALARLDARPRDQLLRPLAGELAVARIRRDAEVDVAVGRRIGGAALDQPLDQRDDLGHGRARERLGIRAPEAECVGIRDVRPRHLRARAAPEGTPWLAAAA